MRRFPLATLTLALGLGVGLAGAVQAQTIGYNIRTGDVWVDNRLGEINDYGYRYREPFVDELTAYYGAPRPLVLDLLDRRNWAPADVYYACAIARTLRMPCQDIVHEYERNPGQGWGVIAKRHGIKPGSREFHALKHGTAHTYDRWGYPVRVVDRDVRIDWSDRGPGRTGHAGKGKSGAGQHAVKVKSEVKARGVHKDSGGKGHGNSKGHGNNKGPDHGKGKDHKGNGKGNGKPA
ncbi:hypothetical protein GCM10023332_02660 [Luteimonas vadosa]|uniref:Uncharacterized protein n=2 Tax=Luteimonas vadosa TaxID=1165507 RepID=A0ABP9DSI5_9GAMM